MVIESKVTCGGRKERRSLCAGSKRSCLPFV